MKQRGRKSAASNLVTFPAIEHRPRLVPPSSLSKSERLQFIELVDNAGHLKPVDVPLLAALAQTIILTRKLARDPAKVGEWERATRTQLALTRSLRLSPQSRVDARAAGRHDLSGIKPPWE
jgi:hypothetical protein